MTRYFFLKGILLGFAIAAPVGPIGILCIRKTLQFGRFSGLFSGLGAAVADTLYGIIAAFGLTMVSDFLISEQMWLKIIGGIFLLYLGLTTFFAKPLEKSHTIPHTSLISDFLSTFLLTLTNPLTIFSYLAIFAALGFTHIDGDYSHATWLVSGVFLGSALWWLLLSEGVTLFRKRVNQTMMIWINRIAGGFIIAFGLATWASLLLKKF
jgi:threonine/homoserine/homoserine lactone efflux protein